VLLNSLLGHHLSILCRSPRYDRPCVHGRKFLFGSSAPDTVVTCIVTSLLSRSQIENHLVLSVAVSNAASILSGRSCVGSTPSEHTKTQERVCRHSGDFLIPAVYCSTCTRYFCFLFRHRALRYRAIIALSFVSKNQETVITADFSVPLDISSQNFILFYPSIDVSVFSVDCLTAKQYQDFESPLTSRESICACVSKK
jgi:hypothetical protein